MSHYDQAPIREAVFFSQVDFGAGANITKVIAVPKDAAGNGMRGKVLGARVRGVSEDFAGSTSDAAVQVGDGTTAGKYFDSGTVLDETVDIGESVYLQQKASASKVDIEAGRSSVTVTFVVSAGTPTGIADVDLHVVWW